MVSQTPAGSPRLSSFLLAAQEWMQEEYAPAVVRQALDAREQVSSEVKRALDTAIRSSGVRVPGGGFRPQTVHRAPSHHLQMPVFRKMQESDELVGAILRVWEASKTELYEMIVQHLQGMDEPTYGPDRKMGCFRGIWDAKDWDANRDLFLAEHDRFDQDDVGLMLWCVSGKIPVPITAEVEKSTVEKSTAGVDFARWQDLMRALPPDAPQWEEAQDFTAAVAEIVAAKEKERSLVAVNTLKAKVTNIREQFSDELAYLERDMDLWISPAPVHPSIAAQVLGQAEHLRSLLAQYRPIRDQAEVRSEEQMRATRRAGLEAGIIASLGEMERFLSVSQPPEQVEAPVEESGAVPELAPVAVADVVADNLVVDIGVAASDKGVAVSNDALAVEQTPIVEAQPVKEVPAVEQTPIVEAQPVQSVKEAPAPVAAGAAQDAKVETVPMHLESAASQENNASLLLDFQSLRDEIENLKSELHSRKDNEEYWRNAYVDAAKNAAKGEEPFEEISRPRDVNSAVVLAEKRFSDELLFQLNSKSWTKNNPYEDPQAVLDALEWLATTYYRSRIGEINIPRLDDSIYEVCRWKYVSNQSDVTMGQYESSYKTVVNGKTYWLEEHIGRGSSKDPVNTIRIAFHWDKEQRRVIIGYIGQHQQTDAT